METRSLNELYREVLKRFDERERRKDYFSGIYICYLIDSIKNPIESEILKNHFISQKPNKNLHQEFYNHKNFVDDYAWWDWKNLEDVYENDAQRRLFIEKMIKITQE